MKRVAVLAAALTLIAGARGDNIMLFGDGYGIDQTIRSEETREKLERDTLYNKAAVVVPPGSAMVIDKSGVVRVHEELRDKTIRATVKRGTFRRNLERLADDLGYPELVWDGRVQNCPFQQATGYMLSGLDPRELLSYYASTHNFELLFDDYDGVVEVRYAGSDDGLLPCKQGRLTTAPLPMPNRGSWEATEAAIVFERATRRHNPRR